MSNVSWKAGTVHDIRFGVGEFSLPLDVAWLAAVEIASWFHYGGLTIIESGLIGLVFLSSGRRTEYWPQMNQKQSQNTGC
jgi:hypothetical protein